MKNIKDRFSCFKRNTSTTLATVKKKITNRSQEFKENLEEAKKKPKSKRKSLLLGFTTVLGIFGVTLLTPVLPAIAKDIPKNSTKPNPSVLS